MKPKKWSGWESRNICPKWLLEKIEWKEYAASVQDPYPAELLKQEIAKAQARASKPKDTK